MIKGTTRWLVTLLALSLCLFTFGCSRSGSGSTEAGDGSGSLSESDLNAERERRFGEGGIPTAEGEGMFRDITFEYNSASVDSTGRQDIDYNAQVLREQPDLKIQLEGHCDERGTAEYNLALGQERARAVQEVLMSLGIPKSRLETISYGEEVPLDTGHDEAAWAKNRRVHFSAFSGTSRR
jgi:peptidoglycan-associated lipoprotein